VLFHRCRKKFGTEGAHRAKLRYRRHRITPRPRATAICLSERFHLMDIDAFDKRTICEHFNVICKLNYVARPKPRLMQSLPFAS
jgi:hypothetical protein